MFNTQPMEVSRVLSPDTLRMRRESSADHSLWLADKPLKRPSLKLLAVAVLLVIFTGENIFAATSETPPSQPSTEPQPGASESSKPSAIQPRSITETDAPSEPRQDIPAVRTTEEFPGIPIGTFRLLPDLSISETYDTNIYAERTREQSDFITTISPSIVLKSNWREHALNFEAGADLDRYVKHAQENINDYWVGADGRFDLGPATNLFGGLRFNRDHEDRGEPDALSPTVAAKPTLYDHTPAYLGGAFRLNQFSFRLGGTVDRFDFHDVRSVLDSDINMDDRDRVQFSLGARIAYALSPAYDLFLQYASDTRRYDSARDDAGYQRDSRGYRAAAGVRVRMNPTLEGEAFIGGMGQKYQDDRFRRVTEPYFGADLTWRKTPRTTISSFIDRSLEETTSTGASAYLDTAFGLRVEHRITPYLSVNARIAYIHSDYRGIDRLDKIIDAGGGLRFYFLPMLYLGADYRMLDRRSNELVAEYSRSQVMLNIGYEPGRARSFSLAPDAVAATPYRVPAADFFGPYAGAVAGYGTLDTVTEGARGEEGSDLGPMGDAGATEGGFLGYGWTLDRWYLGIEAEGEASQANWYLRKDKLQSRTARVEKNAAGGPSLRFGYVVDNGSLLYGRVGTVWTKFQTFYTQNDPAAVPGAYDRHNTLNGIRFGVGTDIPVSSNAFVRLDYTHTLYHSYDVNYLTTSGPTIERFDPSESLFRLGLGWRFGGKSTLPAVPADPASGFYAGVHASHGTLNSQLDGLHADNAECTNATPCPFTGAFSHADAGGGFFAGYGVNLRRWYVGVELETDVGNLRWKHKRDTAGAGGREFSSEKKSNYGAALRFGYSLHNGTLLYVRIGGVRGRFNTTWAKGANPDANVDRSDVLNGFRAGVGAEVPLNHTAFIRLDYSHSDYQNIGFVSTHANRDAMTFNNQENLFRLGLGFRF